MLVGLTATPGASRRELGAALVRRSHRQPSCDCGTRSDGGMLCPFQYFGVHDDVDLAGLEWKRGGYDETQLDGVYTGNDARAAKSSSALREIVSDPRRDARQSVSASASAHAQYMARYFRCRGLRAAAIDGTTPRDERRAALLKLGRRLECGVCS